jgi:hypothetical protein
MVLPNVSLTTPTSVRGPAGGGATVDRCAPAVDVSSIAIKSNAAVRPSLDELATYGFPEQLKFLVVVSR